MKGRTIAGIALLVSGLGLAACGGTRTIIVPQAATPTVTVTHHAQTPRQTVTVVQPPAAPPATPSAAPPTSYAQDITNAGIVAPVDWINRTGEQLCADWRNGMTTVQTDPILLAGGIHPNHLALFDSITQSDLCPDVSP